MEKLNAIQTRCLNANSEIAKYKLHVVALQKVRWLGNGNVQAENATIFYSDTESNRRK